MSLRLKLLLAALCTLALPWSGWQSLRQTDQLLREGQEQAWLASAQLLAKALQARGLNLPAGELLYAQRAREPITLDGYADDWSAQRPYAQALGPADDPRRLAALLARRDGDLYLLIEVRDGTRARFDVADPRSAGGDHVSLVLERAGQSRRYRLVGAAPGSFVANGQGDAAALPATLDGALQEDGSGYRIELRIAQAFQPERIGIGMYDSARGGEDAPALRKLADYDAALARLLQAMVPVHARARLLGADGWVLADAGQLDVAPRPARERVGGLFDWLYRHFIAPAFDGSTQLDGNAPRLDASEVWQALSGVSATSWRPADAAGAVVLAAAIPLDAGAAHGALLFEQANPTLPLLANRALSGLLNATLIALVIASAILLVFGASLSWRIRRLRNAAEQATRAGGHLHGALPLIHARDELGDLARSFGTLLDEVAGYTDYLRTLASKLSHELNTPLAIVKSSLDNLDHEPLPATTRAYLVRARDGADRLATIVRAMSEASRIERAIASAEGEDFDLRALVTGCGEGYRALAAPRELRLQVPAAPLPMHGAPDLIAQALDKLFDNACSFTPADGWIALSLQASADGALVRVSNQGPLLPAAMQERLFDSLVSMRSGAARGGNAPHLGLGLYVVRLVAQLHRGSASAGNLADGSGVEFRLALAGMPRRRLSDTAEGE